MIAHILLILGGVLVGWMTKIPVFLHHYHEWERETKETRAMIDRILDVFKKLNEERDAKTHPPSPLEGAISDFTKSQKDSYSGDCKAVAESV